MSSISRAANSVFINCPFDDKYRPLFEVIVFAVYACGFLPRCALEESDGGDVRIEKIMRLIKGCHYSIHDISEVKLDRVNRLPRFNMPFELGLDLGSKRFGPSLRRKKLLILDTEPYRYQKFLSDIAGQDIRAHNDDVDRAATVVRHFLRTASQGKTTLPGDAFIRNQFAAFARALPNMCTEAELDRRALQYVDYARLVEIWLEQASDS